jgi:GR25 family glycosyltransferase involved in LPS biosynthesis
MNKIVDQVYVINLEKNTDRKEKIINLFEKLKINFKFFNAIYYKEEKERILNLDKYIVNSSMRDGEIGCFLSHVCIIENFIKNTNYEKICIFEDDIDTYICSENLNEKITKLNDKNLDFDIFYLGKISDCCSKLEKVYDNVFKNSSPYGNHAYIINRNMGEKIIKNLPFSEPIDISVNNLIRNENLNSYTFAPSIFYQNIYNFESDLRGVYLFNSYNDCRVELDQYINYYMFENLYYIIFLLIVFFLFLIIFIFLIRNFL